VLSGSIPADARRENGTPDHPQAGNTTNAPRRPAVGPGQSCRLGARQWRRRSAHLPHPMLIATSLIETSMTLAMATAAALITVRTYAPITVPTIAPSRPRRRPRSTENHVPPRPARVRNPVPPWKPRHHVQPPHHPRRSFPLRPSSCPRPR
jgi:hypothetical protein